MHDPHEGEGHEDGSSLAPSLATFVAVHRAGGIGAAGEDLHLSQPAVSRRLQVLERQLGVPLFDRTPAGLRLSSAGEVLLPHAERVCAAERDARAALRHHRDGTSGTVHLGIVGSLAGPWLTDLLARVARAHPDVEVLVATATSRQLRDQVRSGDLTAGVGYLRPVDEDLEVRTLFAERLAVVCHPDHRHAGRRVRDLGRLRQERWLVFPDQPGHPESASSTARRLLGQHQVPEERLRPIDSLTAQLALVAAGYGLAFLPDSAVAGEVARGRLATVDVAGAAIEAPVTLLTRAGAYRSPAAATVLDLLAEAGPPT